MTKQRLARLERALKDFCGRPCTMCWGEPVAAVLVEWEEDPHGPGLRRARPPAVAQADRDRIGDDMRCRRCGAAAAITLLEVLNDAINKGSGGHDSPAHS